MTCSKSALVTGGAGFIGSNLCRRLLSDGYQVTCMDNFFTSRQNNVSQLQSNPNFKLLEHDIIEPFDVFADEIYHLAAPASPIHYQKDPVYTIKTIVFGTLHALECAERNHAKLLLTSTSEIYGEPLEHPQKESYFGNVNLNGVRACYDESKRCAETLCSDYRRSRGVDAKIIRIFNTYGPYMDKEDGRVVSEFILKTLNGQPIVVHGTGQQTRSFCFVSDLVEGILLVMNSDIAGPVNLGNPNEITILQLAQEIATLLGKDIHIKNDIGREDEPSRRKPDITLAKSLLNWSPKISLVEGLSKTIEYFSHIQENC